MRLRVRTPEGELTFSSRLELTKAYTQGLVDPGDEVQEEGSNRWRKAGEIPELAGVRPSKVAFGKQWMRTGLIVGLSLTALVLLFAGDNRSRMIGLVLAFAVAWLLMGTTYRVFRNPRT